MGAGVSTVSEEEAKQKAEEGGIAWDAKVAEAWEKLPHNESGGVDASEAEAAILGAERRGRRV